MTKKKDKKSKDNIFPSYGFLLVLLFFILFSGDFSSDNDNNGDE